MVVYLEQVSTRTPISGHTKPTRLLTFFNTYQEWLTFTAALSPSLRVHPATVNMFSFSFKDVN